MRTPHTVFQNRRLLESAPRLIVLWTAVAISIINAGPSPVASKGTVTEAEVVLDTANAPMLSGPFQTVNDGFGVAQQITSHNLPLDTTGIYLVLATPDVTDIRPDGSMYCTPGAFPHHGTADVSGVPLKYAFIGHPMRCPTSAAPQFIGPDGSMLPSPNGNFAADGMASMIAHALSALVTNPSGTGWFDRFGFENAAKCQGTFGQTYQTASGAGANIKLGARDYLLQQNWVNARKGYCGLSAPGP